MTIAITHAKTNNIADWTQADLDAQIALGNYPPGTLLADIVLPSDWNDDLTTSMATNKLVGRSTAGTGSFEEITVGAGLSLVAGTLSATGGAATAWGDITGTLSNQTDLQTALNAKVTANGAITGATKTKITYDAKGLVTSGADATTADIADSSNKRYVTDAQLTVLGNTSGANTGDQNLFRTIAVAGQSDVVADSTTDTLTLVAGTNITITTDAGTDSITINASGGSGITSINSQNGSSQTLVTGTSGTDFAVSSATNTHTFNLPTASTTNRGAITSLLYTQFASGSAYVNWYGDGSDGSATISGTTTLTRDMYYSDVTVQNGGVLDANGFRICVSGTLTVDSGGRVSADGVNGNNGSGTSPGANTTTPTNASIYSTSGSAGIGAAGSGGSSGTSGAGTNAATPSLAIGATQTGGNGGKGGGGASSGAGGTNTAPTLVRDVRVPIAPWATSGNTSASVISALGQSSPPQGGAGGSGGGGVANSGGGGSGGAGGKIMYVWARIIVNNGIIRAIGGNGGNGANGTTNGNGGGGGGGGSGGTLFLFYTSYSGSGSISVAGGTKGTKGNGAGTGVAGADGNDGGAGVIRRFDLTANTLSTS